MSGGIDWLAVGFACNGTAMRLRGAERRLAVRRMADRLSAVEIGRRIGCTSRSVERIKAALPVADTATCPVCRERVWVVGAVVEAHPDRLMETCLMSGRMLPTGDARRDLAAGLRWVAAELRAGRVEQVCAELAGLEAAQLRLLLVAALAGVDAALPLLDHQHSRAVAA
ncbi:hypothetical protein [Mycobacterium heckeshornense]|uniref:DUF7368 family protein n=1 Tax=Mycobacterium heckeshornense TaxID=110505 RepID=UPI00066238E5|nr:hypothetical protein [Mycobacterium heckeshornense]KMV23357.1 hypothetical protein ACT16_06750 [Mycobacterium heckeshornense]